MFAASLMTLTVLAASPSGQATSCDDRESWARWQALIEERRAEGGSPALEYLFDLRRFLCGQVAQGRLTEADAGSVFEAERQRLLNSTIEPPREDL